MTTSSKTVQATDKWLGLRIRQRRRALSLTQVVLAERIGLTFQQIQKYEKGLNRVAVSRLYEIAAALETEIGWFLEDSAMTTSPFANRLAEASTKDADFIAAYFELPENMRAATREILRVVNEVG